MPAHAPYPGVETPLGTRIASLLADPFVGRAHWGIAVTAMDGTPLFGFNEGQLFRPASNAKLFTTAAAMALLGADTRVTTIVSADAPPDADGVLHGDLTIHGVGDPSLSGRIYPYESPEQHHLRLQHEPATSTSTVPDEVKPIDDLAAQIAAAGVRSLTGHVRGDSSLWRAPDYGDTWDVGDAVWGYGASVGALEFNDGQLEMTVHPGLKAGDAASLQITPNIDNAGLPLNQVTTVATTRDAEIDILPGQLPAPNTVIGAVALGHSDSEEISVPQPALFAASVLRSRLLAQGIAADQPAVATNAPQASALPRGAQWAVPVDFNIRPESLTSPVCGRDFSCGVVLAKHVSPTLAEDVAVTLKVSQNLHAEMFLRRLGRAYGTEGSFAQGTRVVRQWLQRNAGLDADDFIFYDGSGLSSHDLVAPRATAHLLQFASTQPWFTQWKAALPVGGIDGSLASRFTTPELKGKVFAKTGTLGESRALSGYLVTASGRTVIFSIMVDDHTPTNSSDKTAMDQIVAAIATAE
jgi:D-alanyl-D-alanine carboxypeptidase/D-alanyl-D-alanine-endopeptidase (penicillin-binding protein 4)